MVLIMGGKQVLAYLKERRHLTGRVANVLKLLQLIALNSRCKIVHDDINFTANEYVRTVLINTTFKALFYIGT